jgi:AraC-like DNA-binding protein
MLTNFPSINDTLSTILSTLRLRAFVAGAFDAGGDWAIEFPAADILRFKVILRGECWLSVEGERKTHHLKTGDCFLLTGGKGFVLAKDLSLKRRIRAETMAQAINKDGIAVCNGGGDLYSIGTFFAFEGHFPKIIFGHLPSVIHIPAHLDQAAVLRWSLERFSAEIRGRNAGRSLMLSHLAPIMLLQTLRIYLASAEDEKNWLVALSDPNLSRAIEAVHRDCKRNWSLDDLAKTAGMSRAGFALNFKTLVGVAPIEYLTHWRMQIARELLQEGKQGVAAIASAVGYESESAFSAAFTKIVKCRPGFYQRNHENLHSQDSHRLAANG